MTKECLICERVEMANKGELPQVIHEFKHTYLVLGDHQFHKGYCVLLAKSHVREVHHLSRGERSELMDEVFTAGAFLEKHFKAWKINYSCLGNSQPHIHWHIFPRYESDKDKFLFPWLHYKEFESATPSAREVQTLCNELKGALQQELTETE